MKLALVTPTFPPDHCGVGDHSFQLKNALEDLGHVVNVHKSPLEIPRETDAILLQYTPYLWSSRRIRLNPALAGQLKTARARTGASLALLAHEVHYPVGWSPRGILLGWGQKLQFEKLARISDRVFFTYAAARERFRENLLYEKSSVLPVGSNIPVETELRGEETLLLHFGGNHPTHCLDWTIHALSEAQARFPARKITLAWVGVGEDEKHRILARNGLEHLAPAIQALGYLPTKDVSRWLARATLVLAPFLDGISTRRGSVMAALDHGRPVATTRGWASDPAIAWDDFCYVSEADAGSFSEKVCSALLEPNAAERISKAARETYRRDFSWPILAARLLKELETDR